jgi:23S rRNA (uracil1939-C5)-methyltransferase
MTDDLLTLRVEKLSSHGEGIAFSEGKAVFIPYSIPGELLTCRIVEDHSSFSRAEPIDIKEASPDRAEPPCPLFGVCGGCSLQHIEYSCQTRLKQDAARETFLRIGGFDPGELEIVTGEPYHYRNRTQIHACGDGGLGFAKAGSSEAIKIPRCPILVPALERWLISENRKARPYRALSALIGERPRFSVFAQDERIYIEGRDAYARAGVRGKNFQFPVAHFFQSNIPALEKLIERCVEPLRGGRALDLYSGAGLFSLFLADNFDSIECVESDTASMEAARLNLSLARAKIGFSDIPVERWIKTPRANRAFDLIVADPPRTGLSPELRAWLAGAQADALLYVSCDHASLAHDLRDLTQNGWKVEDITLFDFYPQTGRLEAVARFARLAR